MLDENDPWLDRVTDIDVVNPLSDIARKERSTLLVANLLMFAVFQMRAIPTKIEFLGLTTENLSAGAIMIVSVLGVVFFAFSFLLTTRSEHRAWRSRLESLRDRHDLRRRYYLEKRIKKMRDWLNSDIDALKFDGGRKLSDGQKQDTEALYIADSNREFILSWNEYKKGYETRYFVDAQLPLIVTAINLAATVIFVYLNSSIIQGSK